MEDLLSSHQKSMLATRNVVASRAEYKGGLRIGEAAGGVQRKINLFFSELGFSSGSGGTPMLTLKPKLSMLWNTGSCIGTAAGLHRLCMH